VSQIHEHFFRNLPLSEAKQRFYTELAAKSLEDQRAMEAADEIAFEEYLQRYYSQA
jgi:glutamate--cysteine ligase